MDTPFVVRYFIRHVLLSFMTLTAFAFLSRLILSGNATAGNPRHA